MAADQIRLVRSYPAAPSRIWELWTTQDGIESWWPPDGFTAEVQSLDLRPGGELIYTFTATAAAQIEFLNQAGLPLTTHARKTFTELQPPERLGYVSHVDFVPGVEPYEQLTTVELRADGVGTEVTMTMDPLHDAQWTQRLVMGRQNELDNLARVITEDPAA